MHTKGFLICLGVVGIKNSNFYVKAFFDHEGIFAEFKISGNIGDYSVRQWHIPDNCLSGNSLLIRECCDRLDILQSFISKNADGIVDIALISYLKSKGIDFSSHLRSGVIMRGRMNFEIATSYPPVPNDEPPVRSDYSDHKSYRMAMNHFMDRIRFASKHQNKPLLSITEVDKPSSTSICAYNKEIALYQYHQKKLHLLGVDQ